MALMDIVDENDNVVGQKEFEEVYSSLNTKNPMLFRTVAVLVFDSKGRVLVQKRSKDMYVSPGLWDSSVAGHIDVGDSYRRAATKELEEEIGISVEESDLVLIRKAVPNKKNSFSFTCVFLCSHDGPFIKNEEVEEIKLMHIHEILDDIEKNPEKYTQGFRKNIEHYIRWSGERKNQKNMS